MYFKKMLISKLVFIVYCLYIVLGNLLRITPFSFHYGNLNIGEIVLYILVLLFILTYRKISIIFFPKSFVLIYLLFLFSFLFESVYLQRFLFIPLFYNIRIFFYFLSSFVIGLVLFMIYKNDILNVAKFYVLLFFISLIPSWIIYFLFPKSEILWYFLSKYGIVFKGDPHIHRLVGVFLDPNFYGNILIFPSLISLFLFETNRKFLYLFLFFFFVLSIFFTFSRSSFLGLFIGLFLYFSRYILSLRKYKIKKSFFYSLVSLGLFIAISIFLFHSQLERLINRFLSLPYDPSAHHRFGDFFKAIQVLFSSFKVFFLGVGYNFLYSLHITELTSFDSSLFSIAVTLGVPATFICIYFILNFIFYIQPLKEETLLLDFYKKVLLNGLLSSLVISNFNNLLLYQFWFFVYFPVINYLYLLKCIKYK